MYDVITLGSSTVDVFARTAKKDSDLITIKTHDSKEEFLAYQLGTKILITDLQFQIGGGGTNTAVSFARMGLKTAYLMKVGNDDNGDRVLDLLEKEGIEFIGVRGKIMSGYSVILDSVESDRTILTYKGANNNLKYSEIDKKQVETRWIYASSLLEESFKTLKKLIPYVKKKGIKVAFNPSCYQAEMGHEVLSPILKNTDVLILNFEEAKKLTGRKCSEEIEKDLLKILRKLGPKIVIITNGREGAHCYDGKDFYFLKAKEVKIMETTGAGDAFSSGFISGLINDGRIDYSLKVGLANAQSVIQHYGAKNVLLTWKQAQDSIKKNKYKVKKY